MELRTRAILGLLAIVMPFSLLGRPGTFDWQPARPEDVGLSSDRLQDLLDTLKERSTRALLVVRHDRIVLEWYGPGMGADVKHYTASLAKALVGGMSLALALQDGLIGIDDPAELYIDEWKDDPTRSGITIRHLATHSSGLEDAESAGLEHFEAGGWKSRFWKRDPDPFTVARDWTPMRFKPGEGFEYSNPGMAMLGYAVTATLQNSPHRDLRTLLRERIMRPIGVPDADWSIGYGETYPVNGLALVANWGGGAYTARAVARVGRLMLRRGDWDGSRLLDSGIAGRVVNDAGTTLPNRELPEGPCPRAALAWWVNSDGVLASLPEDAFIGAGAGNQVLLVVPSLDLIAVRFGGQLQENSFWGGLEQYLFRPLMRALQSRYPPSRMIRQVSFDPESSVQIFAPGSDNWPITWGDDDCQYAAYGDGWGFTPLLPEKLSLGFARICGEPENLTASHVRSVSGERKGDGPAGPKASGMLMVDGVLYMWVRNMGNATLAWSEDHGSTWTWGFTISKSFGSPAFLNFGRNYSGAFDRYVYVYSQDGPSAYESNPGMVLARCPKNVLQDRDAWEFFAGFDGDGEPSWSRDIDRRRPVFDCPGPGCQRSDAVFHPGLERYLLLIGFNHEGGWGIFDAPEPWGPWSTVYYTEDWGLGATHGYRLPARWINSEEGSAVLVFSGRSGGRPDYDAFCLRRIYLGR